MAVFSPGGGLRRREGAVHGDWPGEINQTAGAAEPSARGPRKRDVGVLEKRRKDIETLKADIQFVPNV